MNRNEEKILWRKAAYFALSEAYPIGSWDQCKKLEAEIGMLEACEFQSKIRARNQSIK